MLLKSSYEKFQLPPQDWMKINYQFSFRIESEHVTIPRKSLQAALSNESTTDCNICELESSATSRNLQNS